MDEKVVPLADRRFVREIEALRNSHAVADPMKELTEICVRHRRSVDDGMSVYLAPTSPSAA